MDNQITGTQNKNTIMGMFAGIESSLNGLLRSSDKFMGTNLLVKVQHEDNYMVIPVNIIKNGKVSYSVEEGIKTDCQHIESSQVEGQLYNNCDECGEYVEQDCNE